jgi:hypothetical protein
MGRVAVYNPEPAQELTFTLEAAALRTSRQVRVRSGDRELARWRIPPGAPVPYVTPRFRLAGGLGELTLESDDEERPVVSRDSFDEAKSPYSLRVTRLILRPAK